MEKEIVTKFDLESAFKALDEIEIPAPAQKGRCLANRVNLQERLNAKAAYEVLVEDYFDINSTDDLEAAKEEREAEVAKAKLARIEKIVDLDAESKEDILPSYVGKIIIQCPQCMTLFYKNEEDIENSEETPEVVNINEICQHCGNSSGYNLIGRVGGIEESEASNFDLEGATEEEIGAEEFEAEPAEENAPAEEGSDTTEEASEDEEELDLDLDLDLDLEDDEEEEEETNESMHLSKLLKDAKKAKGLKSDIDSEHLTLNEDSGVPVENTCSEKALKKAAKDLTDLANAKGQVTAEDVRTILLKYNCQSLDEDLADLYRKTFDKPASVETQQAWEDELNGEMGEISDKRRNKLEKKFAQQRDWENRHKAPEADGAKKIPETETETVAVESLNNSELLKDAEKGSNLKSENGSENLTLEEDVGDWVRKTFDKPASIKTQQSWEDELNGEMGEISNKRRAQLERKFAQQRAWETKHAEPNVKAEEEKEPEKVLATEAFADADDLDEESINKHLTEYFTKVYSNVKSFEVTGCSLAANELILEGLIKFNSGNEKTTTFRFEPTTEGLVGKNADLTEQAAFKLSAKTHNKVLITENFKYCYNIEGATVKGITRV